MLTFTEAQVLAWITPILWPFLRVLALFGALPVFAQRGVPARVRVALAFLIAYCAQATLPPMPVIPLDSALALLAVVQQMLIGLVVSIFQAATQIHEATLSFVPKIIGAVAVLAIAGPWMLTTLVEYIQRTLQSIPSAVG